MLFYDFLIISDFILGKCLLMISYLQLLKLTFFLKFYTLELL